MEKKKYRDWKIIEDNKLLIYRGVELLQIIDLTELIEDYLKDNDWEQE